MRRKVANYEALPNGYGIAYRLYDKMYSVCYPYPLNIVIGRLRAIWFAIRFYMPYSKLQAKTFKSGYDKGFSVGLEIGERNGLEKGINDGYEKKRKEIEAAFQEIDKEFKQFKQDRLVI